eukprot:5103385-Karenia_brevis.AAC.1
MTSGCYPRSEVSSMSPGAQREHEVANFIATIPYRMGGLGLRSAQRMAPAAYWASWADGLEMIKLRCPDTADRIVRSLDEGWLPEGTALRELQDSREHIQREGGMTCPSWAELAGGARPQQTVDAEPGEWAHGWQFYAAAALDDRARQSFLTSEENSDTTKALLRSQSGLCSGRTFSALPTSSLCKIP